MYIYKYEEFLLEHSKSDPIPELTWKKQGKTAIFLMGAPGSGKSTFVNNYILPKLRNYKVFDSDKLMMQLLRIGKEVAVKGEQEMKDKIASMRHSIHRLNTEYDIPIKLTDNEIMDIINNNVFIPSGTPLLDKQFITFMEYSNSDVIYDSTGTNFENIERYTNIARSHGYKILFIKINTSIESSVRGNLERQRKVQIDYQLDTIEKSSNLERKFMELNPDAYYIYDRENSELLPAKEMWEKTKLNNGNTTL